MQPGPILIASHDIAARVTALAEEIARDHRSTLVATKAARILGAAGRATPAPTEADTFEAEPIGTAAASMATRPLVLLAVLSGSVVFAVDLARALAAYPAIDVRLVFVRASSYGDGTESAGAVKFPDGIPDSLQGRDVVVVEDIVDTGRTMASLCSEVAKQRPSSLRVATLLHKPDRAAVETPPLSYVGFVIENHFVVGYGLDLAERFRHLPDVHVCMDSKTACSDAG